MPLLLLTLGAACFMTGVGWLIAALVYPQFVRVGAGEWRAYHAAHSRRVTPVVLAGMATELAGAALVVLLQPRDAPVTLGVLGLACALIPFAVTGVIAVPAHSALAAGFDGGTHRRLLRAHAVRTLAWTIHGVLAAVMVAQTAG